MNSENVESWHSIIISPTWHVLKVERVTTKTGCTSCTKWRISFEVSRFQMKTHLLQRDYIFLNLFELQTFCVFKMHHSKPHHQFQPFLTSLVIFHAFTDFLSYKTLKLKKALQMNSEKVESWHGIIISPT